MQIAGPHFQSFQSVDLVEGLRVYISIKFPGNASPRTTVRKSWLLVTYYIHLEISSPPDIHLAVSSTSSKSLFKPHLQIQASPDHPLILQPALTIPILLTLLYFLSITVIYCLPLENADP